MGKLAGITPTARKMVARGWTVECIARMYGLAVKDVLAILPRRAPRSPRPAPQPKPVDPWKGTWRHRDDPGVETAPEPQIPASQVVDQAPVMARAAEPVEPAPSTWSGPSSPCATSLADGRRRIKD